MDFDVPVDNNQEKKTKQKDGQILQKNKKS